MLRFAIFLIGIVWASLLLISWGGTAEIVHQTDTSSVERGAF